MRFFVVAALASLLCFACGPEELTAEGQTVTAANAPPGPGCQILGQVVGKSSSGGDAIEDALADARNKAGQLGADYIHTDPPQRGIYGQVHHGTGFVENSGATVTATAYRCGGASAPGGSERVTAGGAGAKRSAPEVSDLKGAGGFVFGASAAESQKACEGAGHVWSARGDRFGCDAPVTKLAFAGEVSLGFCAGELCSIILSSYPDAASWTDVQKVTRETLISKYGEPTKQDTNVPAECRDAPAECFLDGRASMHWRWVLPSQAVVSMHAGKPKGDGKAGILLRYERTRVAAEGL